MPDSQPTHPVVKEIVAELQLIRGEVLLPEDRFEHWASWLPQHRARAEHPVLYGQLVGVALTLAQRRAPAAAQLYALTAVSEVPR